MSVQLWIRLVFAALLGALLVTAFGTALQFREIASSATDRLEPDAKLLAAAAEMQRLLGEASLGPRFELAFGEQLELIERSDMSEAELARAADIRAAFEQLLAAHHTRTATPAEVLLVAEAVAAFTAEVGRGATQSATELGERATTTAVALALLGVLALVLGAGVARSLRHGLLRRLHELERAALDVSAGDDARRVPVTGNDELAHIATALNLALDARDRGVAALSGRNRDMRALLVALLRQWPQPLAVTGIDGDILASTLDDADNTRLAGLSAQVRKAAGILISRGFATASELSTDIAFADGVVVHIRALALGDQRFVGWLAEFEHRADASTGAPPS